ISSSEADHLISEHRLQSIQGYNNDRIRTIRVERNALNTIAALPFISYITAVGPQDEPENYSGKTLHRSNVLSSQYVTGRKYDGSGVNVMLQDDGVIGPHIDYEGRIALQSISSNSGDHGDHVAGTIMGAGNLDPTTQGMAPGADIYVYGASPTYPGFASIGSHYGLYNIRVTSTSYSNGCNAGYTSLTRDMDQQVRQLPALMHVFSAGNNGTSDCGYGAGAGWGNITGGHKMGKNVIAVANLDYKDDLSSSSSRGPANDGRIKPDVAAKGSDVVSTTDPNAYTTKSGTSMSCPGTSGTMLQLYHAYRNLNGGADPKGGLMKAILMNSADDIDNPGPDFKTGWGRINALKAVEAIEDVRFATDTLMQGDTNVHSILVP
ncbi:MAG: S8 family serine peptidase, partial [Bacteroidales bacterium]|nr:S8 family serine peptidase [Bacteroidales bacterium]